MEVLKKPGWWVLVVILLLHQAVQYGFGWSLPLLDAYLDPLLVMPILLGLIVMERKVFFGTNRLTALEVVVITVVLSIIFEEVFPRWRSDFVRDPLDYLMYAIGAGWFYLGSGLNKARQ